MSFGPVPGAGGWGLDWRQFKAEKEKREAAMQAELVEAARTAADEKCSLSTRNYEVTPAGVHP